MQPTEGLSVPRRALDVEDYIDILRRHKGWIFGPFLFSLVVSVVGVHLWPDSYTSTAIIKVTPQQISPTLIPQVSVQDTYARIDSLRSQVLSRSELTSLRNSLNLYPREKLNMAPEDLNEKMRNDIKMTPITGGPNGRNVAAISVSFSYPNRLDAVKVVTALVSNLTQESMRVQDRQTVQQVEFFRSQAESSKKKLDAIEAEITAFKLANPGKLPDQMNANMMGMQSAQTTLNSLMSATTRVQNQKLQGENEIRNLKDQLATLTEDNGKGAIALSGPSKSSKVATLEAKLDDQQDRLATMLIKYTEEFGAVKDLKQQIANTQQQLDKAREEEDSKKTEEAPKAIAQNPRIQDIRQQISRWEVQLKALDSELAGYKDQERRANAALETLNSRLSSMPVGDQKWAELTRDQLMARDQYQKDQDNLRKAEVANEIENKKQGEILEPLDPPSVPTDPTSPNRPLVVSVGAGVGLVLGLVLAGAREMKDTSLKNLKDVRAYTHMSILGSIPLLENDFVVRRRRRVAWLGWTAACLTAAVLIAGSVAFYFATKA